MASPVLDSNWKVARLFVEGRLCDVFPQRACLRGVFPIVGAQFAEALGADVCCPASLGVNHTQRDQLQRHDLAGAFRPAPPYIPAGPAGRSSISRPGTWEGGRSAFDRREICGFQDPCPLQPIDGISDQ